MTALTSVTPAISTHKIRVLIVDDSAVVRSVLRRQLTVNSTFEVVGMASDWAGTLAMIAEHRPDVLVIDIEMPSLRGPEVVASEIGKLRLPMIVLASSTSAGAATAVDALAAGAADVVAKPVSSVHLERFGAELIRKILVSHALAERPVVASPLSSLSINHVLAIGGSTGGVKALVELLTTLPACAPPTLVVQQLPSGFTSALVRYISARCAVVIKEAEDGDIVETGLALIAPGGRHMLLRRCGSKLFIEVKDGPEVHYERPSIELFFRSVVRALTETESCAKG